MYQFLATTSGQVFPPPTSFVRDSERYYKGTAAVFVFYYTSLWAVKFSFLAFFKRLTKNVAGQKVIWWSVSAFTVASYLVCIGDMQYLCLVTPLEKLLTHCSTSGALRYQQVTLKTNCAMDVLTDYMSMFSFPSKSGEAISCTDTPFYSHGDSDQDVVESPDVCPKKTCINGRFLPCRHHNSVCHRSRASKPFGVSPARSSVALHVELNRAMCW